MSGQQPDPKTVKSHFDDRSATYSDLFDDSVRTGAGHRFRSRRDIIAKLTKNLSGRLLDCATGTGEVTLAVLKSGEFDSAVINDLSEEMLNRSRDLLKTQLPGKSLEFSNTGVFDLPDSAGRSNCDVVMCIGLIAHVGRLEEMFSTAVNLLKPGGQFLFQTTLLDHWGVRMTRRLSEERHVRNHGYAIRHYYHSEIEKAAEENGLNILVRERYGFDFPFLDRVAPGLGHYLEQRFAIRSGTRGSEAIYVLQKTGFEPESTIESADSETDHFRDGDS